MITKVSYSDDYKRKGNYYKIKLIHSNFLNLVHFQPTFFILFSFLRVIFTAVYSSSIAP